MDRQRERERQRQRPQQRRGTVDSSSSSVNRTDSSTSVPKASSETSPAAMGSPSSLTSMDKLSAQIFSKLESNWLSGADTTAGCWLPQLLQDFAPKETSSGASAVKRTRVRILSIDGGGVTALIAARALAYLEDSLRSKSGNAAATIADYFDIVAGSGTGGLLASLLTASPPASADQAWRLLAGKAHRLYTPTGRRFFLSRPRRACSDRSADRVLREFFAFTGRSGATLRDAVKPVLIPCYDMRTSAPLVFSRADAVQSESFDFEVAAVCRAATATPGVFSPATVRSVNGRTACTAVDAGVVMNNPAATAVTHVLNNRREFPGAGGVEDVLLVSVGAGVFERGGAPAVEACETKSRSCDPLMAIVYQGVSDTVDASMAVAFASCPQNYVRVQAMGMSGAVPPDMWEGSVRNVQSAMKMADEMLSQRCVESVAFGGKRLSRQTAAERLESVAEELLAEHILRSNGSAGGITTQRPSSSSSPSANSPASSSFFMSE